MIERISESIAIRIKQANEEETASVAVLKFALIGVINNSLTFILIFLIGALYGKFIEAVIVAFSFTLVRLFAGGFHFKSAGLCIAVSVATLSVVPFLSDFLNEPLVYATTGISFVLTAIYAPSNIKKTRIKPAWRPLYKLVALLMIGANFVIGSSLLALTFLFQAISTIDIKKESAQ